MSSADFLGLLGTFLSIVLWFIIPFFIWITNRRVRDILRITESNQTKLASIEEKLQRLINQNHKDSES